MASRHFNPFDIILQLESDMRRTTREAVRAVMFHPGLDMYETEDALVIKMELAGVKPEQISVTLTADDRYLLIKGERAEQQNGTPRLRCYQLEIYYGPFEREVALPTDIIVDREHISASYRDGFLLISLPKKTRTRNEKRVIEVNRG